MRGRLPLGRLLDDHADVNAVPLEHQYVLYAAATHSSLLDLLTHWQPWLPDLEWSEMAVHIPALADAITVLLARGQIELFLGERGGEVGLVLSAVPDIVTDPNCWWSPVEGTTPETALVLVPGSSPVPLPQRRPEAAGPSSSGHR
jgi:hypothetical protein